jgi:hypothetical protein
VALMAGEPLAKVIPLFGSAGATAPHEPYKLDDAFECATVYRLATSPRLWSQIGRHIDPKAMGCAASVLAVEAVVAIVTDSGRPPTSVAAVMQRLASWQADGKITIDSRLAVREYFGRALDNADVTGASIESMDDAIVVEMATVLRRRTNREIARTAVDDLSKRGDMSRVAQLIEQSSQIGKDPAGGAGLSRVGLNSIPDIVRQQMRERAGTGILELDEALDRGMPCGSLGTYLGFLGAGKSTALVHTSVANALEGKVVAAWTGELSVEDWQLKVLANLFGVPVTALRDEPRTRAALQERMEDLSSWLDTSLRLFVGWFNPKIDTPRSIADAVDALEQKEGLHVDVVTIDYADKLRPDTSQHKDDKGYLAAGDVYESLRLYAHNTKRWVWTGTQATRDKKRKRLEVEDVADSIEKARVADLVVTINPDASDRTQVLWYVGKFRHGQDHRGVGPLPSDFSCSRAAPVASSLYPAPGVDE